MRARELLQENYAESLQVDLDNLLVSAKASGATSISTKDLVIQLQNMGYAVNTNSILSLLSNDPTVTNATQEIVTFSNDNAPNTNIDAEASAEKVRNMAQQATEIA